MVLFVLYLIIFFPKYIKSQVKGHKSNTKPLDQNFFIHELHQSLLNYFEIEWWQFTRWLSDYCAESRYSNTVFFIVIGSAC